MYDFIVFGYYAAAIGRNFFPGGRSGGDLVGLIAALTTFGAGFLARPLGAIILGAYLDRHGRRAGLMLTLGLMAVGTLAISITPSFAAIGLAAPIAILVSRLIQGFSAGVELGGVSVYLSEMATPGHKGFYVSWQSGSQQVAVIVAALIGVFLDRLLSPATVADWGWRIPLGIGCLIIPLVYWLRRSLPETDAFRERRQPPDARRIFRSMTANWRIVGLGMMLVIMTTVSFYLITVYTPTFGRRVLHLSDRASLIVTLCVGLSNLVWLPAAGALSDRIGRRPLLLAATIAAIATAYPSLRWLLAHPGFGHLVAVELWFSAIYGIYNGAMIVTLTEIMPDDVRTSGFSLAYSLATIVGGMTPLICTLLIHATGNGAMPGLWLTGAAAVALLAVILVGRAQPDAQRRVHSP
jgi:MFS family permease